MEKLFLALYFEQSIFLRQFTFTVCSFHDPHRNWLFLPLPRYFYQILHFFISIRSLAILISYIHFLFPFIKLFTHTCAHIVCLLLAYPFHFLFPPFLSFISFLRSISKYDGWIFVVTTFHFNIPLLQHATSKQICRTLSLSSYSLIIFFPCHF